MIRTLIYLFLALFLTLNLSGCSLFGSDEEEKDTATVSEEEKGGDEYAYDDFEEEKAEGDEEGDDSAEVAGDDDFDEGGDEEVLEVGAVEGGGDPVDIETEDSFADENATDEYPDDDYSLDGGESSGGADVAAVAPTPTEDEFADEDSFALDEGEGEQSMPEEPLDSNQEEDLFARDEEPAPAPAESYANNNSYDDDGSGFADVPAFVPVKKMKPAAYKRAGANINRLYVARSGEDMAAIANKIYGRDQSDKLYKWNSHFQGKDLKVGDKVYYSSPNNPNDQSMKTFYEDNNISPQYFTAQKDSNFRKVSKKLLGHERSWMEIYATNDSVDDKWSLPAGTQVKYWPEGAAAVTTVAKTVPAPAPEPEPEPEPEVEEVAEVEEVSEMPEEVADIDDPVEMEDSDKDFAPPPAAGSVKPVPPPPPNPVAPPPPPPPPSPLANKLNSVKRAAGGSGLGAQDDSMIMGLLGGLLILAAFILLVFLRRGRSKRVNFSQTQV